MTVDPNQVDGFSELSNAAPQNVPAVPTVDAAKNMVATPGGVLLPPGPVGAPAGSPALTAPQPASPTNAVPTPKFPAPGSFGAKFGAAAAQLIKAGSDPMSAMVTAGIHSLTGTDTQAPSNTTWGSATSNADATRPGQAPPAQPSNGQRVINGVVANLGDIAAATEGGTKGGPFAGIARVAAAETTRKKQEREDSIKMATANAQMLHEQQLLHKTGEDAINASMAIGKQSADEMLSAPNAETVASGKTSDELKKMIDSKAIDPTRDAVFLTGRAVTGNDPATGLPLYRSTYTVIKPGDRIAPSKDNIQFLNKYLPGQDFKEPDDDGKGGQSFDSHTYYMLNQRAMNNFANVQAVIKTSAEADDKVHKVMLEKGSAELRDNSWVKAAIREVAPVKGGDPFLFQKAFNILAKEAATNPDIAKSLPKNWEEQFAYTFGGGEPKKFEDQMTQYSKLQEKAGEVGENILDSYVQNPSKFEGKTPSIREAAQNVLNDPNKSTDEKRTAAHVLQMATDQAQFEASQEGAKETARGEAKKALTPDNNPKGLVGTDFINSLPPGRQNALKAIYEGRMAVNAAALERTDKGQAFMDDIYAAYPDFNATLGLKWPEAWSDAMTHGKIYQAKNNYNTALQHMARIYQNSTWNGLYNPTSKEYQDRQADIPIVTGELAKAVKAGVATQGEADSLKAALSGTYKTPGDARERAAEQTRLLKEKIDEFQDQFQKAAPSEQIRVPLLISDRAQQAYDYIQNAGKNPQQQQQNPAPQGGGVVYNVPDGKGGTVPMMFKDQDTLDKFKTQHGLK